ncbi:hypothetical protein NL533_36015, partial [Klebsiella pneumoniae]|nr:hypothetical protein [Klebsiella pneumoniae]
TISAYLPNNIHEKDETNIRENWEIINKDDDINLPKKDNEEKIVEILNNEINNNSPKIPHKVTVHFPRYPTEDTIEFR